MPSRPQRRSAPSVPRPAASHRLDPEVPAVGPADGGAPNLLFINDDDDNARMTDATRPVPLPLSGDKASLAKAAAWMSGWLAAMLVMLVAGREAARTLHVFQIMEMRSLIGLLLLYPLVRAAGGLRAMRTGRP